MVISIEVKTQKPEEIWGIQSYEGIIKIGDFQEGIVIPLDHWTREEYERQWKEGLEIIKTEKKSCLVASVQDPIKQPLVDWWLLYKEGSKIYIQNQTLFNEPYRKIINNHIFSPETCYRFIRPRKTMSEIGKISEWSVDIWW